jgi:hypothetical protein
MASFLLPLRKKATMHKLKLIYVLSLALVMSLALTSCGGSETPTSTPMPSDTPVPTGTRAPTNTPMPTIDPASLSATELWATVEALEAEQEVEKQHLAGASGSDGAAVQAEIDRLTREIREVRVWAEAAEGGEEVTESVIALTLLGDFQEAREWAWTELETLDTITITVSGPGENDAEMEYTGISLAAFLEAASVGADAEILSVTATDDYTVEIELAAAHECAECMIVLEDDGSLRLVMPNFPSNNWVVGVVSLEAQ